MSSRLDIELTSSRPDGVWTWRKAGAKLPKGEVPASLVPDGASVGDVLRADADIAIDGVDILSLQAAKGPRKDRHETLTVVGTKRDEQLVTTQLAPKGRGGRDRGDRPDRGDRGDRPGRDRAGRGDRPGGDRPSGDRDRGAGGAGARGGERGPGGSSRRPERQGPPRESRPAPKRLRPGRAHRNAVLDDLAPEQRPIAEQVLRGGVPAVRQAVEKQNVDNSNKGLPAIHGDELVALAEGLLPRLRAAEWRDRADAALRDLEELDLRDLRSIVVAADSAGRDEETRDVAQQLRDGLTRRVESEHAGWLDELRTTLAEGRIVRALRLSSRPPKAGSPLPPEMAADLTAKAAENLTPENSQDRWATMIDALAFSPVRMAVKPTAIPSEVGDELKAAVAKVASRLPHIAALFGIDGTAPPKRAPRRKAGDKPAIPKPPAAAEARAEAEIPAESAEPEAVVDEAPIVDAAPVVEPVVEPDAEVVAAVEADPVPDAEPVADAEPSV